MPGSQVQVTALLELASASIEDRIDLDELQDEEIGRLLH